jgi:hypothetical protein
MDGDEKLRERMQRSKAGWGQNDLETLYLSYGFTFRDGGPHRIYKHLKYPILRATVSRHSDLPIGYVQTALKLIRQLEQMEEEHE